MNTKKAIILGTLGAILIGLVSFFATKYSKSTNKISTTYADVQTCTGYWYINNEITAQKTESFKLEWDITYKDTSSTQYNKLIFTYDNATQQITEMSYKNNETTTLAYNFSTNTWQDENYKYINITGGNDKNNITLYQWLQTNAEYIAKTTKTLQNTTWQLATNINLPAGYGRFSVKFFMNGQNCERILIGYHYQSATFVATAGTLEYYSPAYYISVAQNHQWQWTTEGGTRQKQWITFPQNQESLTDYNNPKLITWLYKNAQEYTEITTLNNTQWHFETITQSILNGYRFNVNFISNGHTYNRMYINYTTNPIIKYQVYNGETEESSTDILFTGSQWTDPQYQYINIFNVAELNQYGQQIYQEQLKSFLLSNATGINVTPIPNTPNNYDVENGNFISLQNLMLNILTMPFTFIYQAFNVTLWPNTAWEFNISNFIMSIIAIATILFIIKVFTSGFAVMGNYTGHPIETHEKNKKLRSETKLNKERTKLAERTNPNEKTIKRR